MTKHSLKLSILIQSAILLGSLGQEAVSCDIRWERAIQESHGNHIQMENCGYLCGYDVIYKRFGKLKIAVPTNKFVLESIQKSQKEQKPDLTASEFQSLLGRFLKAKIDGVTSETTYDQIWIILCYNNIRIYKDKDNLGIVILESYMADRS